MRHSRNAQRAWPTRLPHTAPPAGSELAAGALFTPRRDAVTAAHDGRRFPSDAFRVACRFFPGFAELPPAFHASLDAYMPLFERDTPPLTLHEREVIARAITGRDPIGFGAPAPDEAPSATTDRDDRIAEFAGKVTSRWRTIAGADVQRLLDAGLSAQEVRAVAETAAIFHFLAEVSAAMLLRPRSGARRRTPVTPLTPLPIRERTGRALERRLV